MKKNLVVKKVLTSILVLGLAGAMVTGCGKKEAEPESETKEEQTEESEEKDEESTSIYDYMDEGMKQFFSDLTPENLVKIDSHLGSNEMDMIVTTDSEIMKQMLETINDLKVTGKADIDKEDAYEVICFFKNDGDDYAIYLASGAVKLGDEWYSVEELDKVGRILELFDEEEEGTTEITDSGNSGSLAPYVGNYESEDGSVSIYEDGLAEITIFRLTDIEGWVTEQNGGILTIYGLDANGNDIYFDFDADSHELVVTDSTWTYLANGDTFQF